MLVQAQSIRERARAKATNLFGKAPALKNSDNVALSITARLRQAKPPPTSSWTLPPPTPAATSASAGAAATASLVRAAKKPAADHGALITLYAADGQDYWSQSESCCCLHGLGEQHDAELRDPLCHCVFCQVLAQQGCSSSDMQSWFVIMHSVLGDMPEGPLDSFASSLIWAAIFVIVDSMDCQVCRRSNKQWLDQISPSSGNIPLSKQLWLAAVSTLHDRVLEQLLSRAVKGYQPCMQQATVRKETRAWYAR